MSPETSVAPGASSSVPGEALSHLAREPAAKSHHPFQLIGFKATKQLGRGRRLMSPQGKEQHARQTPRLCPTRSSSLPKCCPASRALQMTAVEACFEMFALSLPPTQAGCQLRGCRSGVGEKGLAEWRAPNPLPRHFPRPAPAAQGTAPGCVQGHAGLATDRNDGQKSLSGDPGGRVSRDKASPTPKAPDFAHGHAAGAQLSTRERHR